MITVLNWYIWSFCIIFGLNVNMGPTLKASYLGNQENIVKKLLLLPQKEPTKVLHLAVSQSVFDSIKHCHTISMMKNSKPEYKEYNQVVYRVAGDNSNPAETLLSNILSHSDDNVLWISSCDYSIQFSV